ncbi:hypothetical protein PLICRDRAFT_349874 [Plicaturopsis crispa FD-325 SS-3]|uniref:Unplaced genomic scaffold PLICRscaffold_16, whole genome shotgun sequence n=1 Tax=Plicaturopsis crispa FD-325 SS-3 TaxID=944288 RepID=A0A0C9T9N1_PLICR|nr:hypothetical protein PLICRDRAFT_349874 [Plicaturopsis crispa FD-325 SS-3]
MLHVEGHSASFPVEILIQILLSADKRDLPSLCRVNATFRRYGSDLLYHDISTRNPLAVCHTISLSPDLAQRVRSFEISRNANATVTLIKYSYALISDALRCMTRLRALRLHVEGSYAWILRSCTAPLEKFLFSGHADADLVHFLSCQNELREITLTSPNSGYHVDGACLAKLHTISAPPSWLRQLIAGRPVTTVGCLYGPAWSSFLVATLSDFEFLTLSSLPIRKLDIGFLHANLHSALMSRISDILPGIEELTLKNCDDIAGSLDNAERMDSSTVTRRVRHLILALPTLRCIAIDGRVNHLAWSNEAAMLYVEGMSKGAVSLEKFSIVIYGARCLHRHVQPCTASKVFRLVDGRWTCIRAQARASCAPCTQAMTREHIYA